jgi:hypothetical protein
VSGTEVLQLLSCRTAYLDGFTKCIVPVNISFQFALQLIVAIAVVLCHVLAL